MSSQNRRTHDEAFPFDEDDDDDDCIFDPALYQVMTQTGGGSTRPLLEFELTSVGARCNWRNVLHKQRFEATLKQNRDLTRNDNIGQFLA